MNRRRWLEMAKGAANNHRVLRSNFFLPRASSRSQLSAELKKSSKLQKLTKLWLPNVRHADASWGGCRQGFGAPKPMRRRVGQHPLSIGYPMSVTSSQTAKVQALYNPLSAYPCVESTP
jgi:hypothetical protein